jgi:hypothetical protein
VNGSITNQECWNGLDIISGESSTLIEKQDYDWDSDNYESQDYELEASQYDYL